MFNVQEMSKIWADGAVSREFS